MPAGGRKIVLSTGGFNTATTRRRMNQVLEAWKVTFRVCSKDFQTSSVRVLEHVGGVWDFTA